MLARVRFLIHTALWRREERVLAGETVCKFSRLIGRHGSRVLFATGSLRLSEVRMKSVREAQVPLLDGSYFARNQISRRRLVDCFSTSELDRR